MRRLHILGALFACPAVVAVSTGPAQAQFQPAIRDSRELSISAEQWKTLECGELLTQAKFGERHSDIVRKAKVGDEDAAIVMMTFINCPKNRFEFAGWSDVPLQNNDSRPRLGGSAFRLFPFRADCRDKEPIYCTPYNDKGPVGILHRTIIDEILASFASGPVDAYTRNNIDALMGLPQVEALAKSMLKSRNPRAWHAIGTRYSIGKDQPRDNIVRAASYGVIPAINDIFSDLGSYRDLPTFKAYYGEWPTNGFEPLALKELDPFTTQNGRSASLAAGYATSNDLIKTYWRRAASLGWYPGGYSLITAVQPSQTGLTIEPAEAFAWVANAEAVTGLPSAERQRLTPFFEREAARRAARGPLTENSSVAPNIATLTATFIREMKLVNSQANFYQMLAAPFGALPNMIWNEDRGFVEVSSNAPGIAGFYQYMGVDVRDVKCTRMSTAPSTFTCRYMLGGTMEMKLGPIDLGTHTAPVRPKQTVFVWDDGRWTSPQLRTEFLTGLANTQVSQQASRSPRDTLCRALGAGVIAGGGRADSRATDPNTWGC